MKPSVESTSHSTIDRRPAIQLSAFRPSSIDSLRPIQTEFSEIFADLAELFGNPASLGSIYGLLFASSEPLSMEEIVENLGVSAGTASQGLRRLVELEAVKPEKADGERITRYTARLELRPFVAMFLDQQFIPRLTRSAERLAALEGELATLPKETVQTLKTRLDRATKWHRQAKNFLPLVRRFLGK